MVGSPKRLEDLAKIEAGVKITCKRCRRERLVSRDRLIRELAARRKSTAWDLLPANLRCACGAKGASELTVLAMPFTSGEEDGEMLFEALLRAYDRWSVALRGSTTDGAACRAIAEASKELHYTKVAMRAWIVAASERQ